MPFVIEMEAGKWLLVVTPLGMSGGVECLYWTGTINPDGTFNPTTSQPKEIDLTGFSHHGYGLLSPSIAKNNGKAVAIGIVPDITSGDYMYERGWAGTYNLPREWSLDAQNNLVQKPATDMIFPRSTTAIFTQTNFSLSGVQSLNPVSGKVLEIEGTFTVSSNSAQKFGFNLRKNDNGAIKVYYEKSTNKITVDITSVQRHVQDNGSFDGIYTSVLPKTFPAGETLKIHAFLDHSILDLFINDTWAASVRIFATDNNANEVEVFADGGATQVQSLRAWNWEKQETGTGTGTGIPEAKKSDKDVFYSNGRLQFKNISANADIRIYDMTGKLFYQNTVLNETVSLPENRIFIVIIIDNQDIISKKIISF
jgi:beta-fructofuranosidase